MLCYCLKCGKITESKHSKVARTMNGRILRLSKDSVYNNN